VQQQIRTNSKTCLLAFPFCNVVYYNYNCHSDAPGVACKLSLVNILKLSILNKHRYITNYLNRLPATFLLILIYFVFLLEKVITGTYNYKGKSYSN
jgi:hypothetical protein